MFVPRDKWIFLFVDKSVFSEGISCESDGECVPLFRKSLKEGMDRLFFDK